MDCGGPCPPCRDCDPEGKRVFITSAKYSGDLEEPLGVEGGLAGADALCQVHADLAELGGTWKAWLSSTRESPDDDAHDAIDRIADVGPWYLADRCTVVAASRTSLTINGLEAPIRLDENEVALADEDTEVWTGTNRFGRDDTFTNNSVCQRWTTNDTSSKAVYGSPYLEWDNEGWTNFDRATCTVEKRLLCMEQ
ncbi:MAG: hypothetical protein AAFV53_12795 [Myxococcota bacterium]